MNEIPDAYANFQYRRIVGEIVRFIKWGPVILAFLYLLTLLSKNTGKILAERRAQWENIRGFYTPISAARKGERYKGVKVKGDKILYDKDPGLKENRSASGKDDEDEDEDEVVEEEDKSDKGSRSRRRRRKRDESDSDDE